MTFSDIKIPTNIVIREFSGFRLAWDSLILLLIVVSCIFIPYQYAFQQGTALSGFQFIYLVDLIFLIDIGFNFFTSFRSHGVEIRDRHAGILHYSRKLLSVDLLASLPLDLLVWVLFGDSIVMGASLVLSLRLLRLLRLVRLFAILRRWEDFSWSNPHFLRIVKTLVTVFLLMHWLACGWFMTAYASNFPADSWVARGGIIETEPIGQYIRSLYWAITTMTTVGYGDITPARSVEYIFSSVAMLLGASLFVFIIGSIASLLSGVQAGRNRHWERIDSVTGFLRQNQVPAALNFKVRSYYEYIWGRHQGLDTNSMLNDLPRPLRLEIMLQLASNILETVSLFKYCSPVLRDNLLLCLESRTFMPDSDIAREGETGDAIYFIIEGSVEIVSLEQQKSWGSMSDGDYFGFMSLVLGERRTATMTARGFCDMLILGADDFKRIKTEFPEFKDVLKRASAERAEKLSELIIEGVVL